MRLADAALACALALPACGGVDEGEGAGGAADHVGGGGAGGDRSEPVGGVLASGGSTAEGGGGAPFVEPDFDAIEWATGPDVGFGVAFKDTENPNGENAFIGYAGYAIDLASAQAWVRELYRATLREHGVRYVYAVQGPADVSYSQLEIGNSKIAASLVARGGSGFILALAHSSGSYVAHELLRQVAGGLDAGGVTADRIVYFDLDGGIAGLDGPTVARTRRAYFVAARDASTGTDSPNRSSMIAGAEAYPDRGGYYELDGSGAGCNAGATWCLHMTLITTKPHDPSNANGPADYGDYEGRPVEHAFVEAKSTDAGL